MLCFSCFLIHRELKKKKQREEALQQRRQVIEERRLEKEGKIAFYYCKTQGRILVNMPRPSKDMHTDEYEHDVTSPFLLGRS